MESKEVDRRVRRTRLLLTNALMDLMVEKRYDSITVQDIIDRADVGRSTFYAHYRDKEDLLISNFDGLLHELSRHVGQEGIEGNPIIPSLGLFRHMQENFHLYRVLVRGRGLDLIHRNGQDYLSKKVEERISSLLGANADPDVPLSVISNHLAGSLFNTLKWWLDNNMPYSPEHMNEMFLQLVLPGVWSVLQWEPESGYQGSVSYSGSKE